MSVSLLSLFAVESFATILRTGLEIAQSVGLPVTTWRSGDPTRTLFRFAARVLANLESVNAAYIKAGFLSYAEGDWLTLLASEVYGVDRQEATVATSTVTLTNAGGGVYSLDAGEVTVKSTISGATYTSTTGGVLSGVGATLDIEVAANEAGSIANAAINEIDTLVTSLLGVTVTASTAAVGQDEQSDADLRLQCAATLGALSPNGPTDAYEYVARSSELTGTVEVTRALSVDDATDGSVDVYVAGASGAVSSGALALVQTALETWALPLCHSVTALNSSNSVQAVTCEYSGTGLPDEATVEVAFTTVLTDLFASTPIGGTVSHSSLVAALHVALQDLGGTSVSVDVTVPTASVVLGAGVVPTLGALTVTEL